MALIGLQGFVISIVDILAITILQRALGPAVLGRALGAMDSLTSVAMVAGTILAPILVSVAGLEIAFAVGGVVLATTGVIAFAFGRRRGRAGSGIRGAGPASWPGLSLFAAAPRFALEGLAADCRELRVPAGEDVIREGDAPDALYVLVEGAAVVTSGAGGRLNTMAAGDFFGEIGLLKGVPRTATVTSTEPCTLLRIEGRRLPVARAHGRRAPRHARPQRRDPAVGAAWPGGSGFVAGRGFVAVGVIAGGQASRMPNQRARREIANSAFSPAVRSDGGVNVPCGLPGTAKKSTSTRATSCAPNSIQQAPVPS